MILPSRRAARGNLPADVSSFVGRGQDISAARDLLTRTRLLTLTGAGGVGKTRLALRVATEVRRAFRDGVWLVELETLREPELVPHAVAAAFGLEDNTVGFGWAPRSHPDVVLDHLRDKHALLVLDSCEHLAVACARLIASLLACAPGLRIITTSRQPLGVAGEHLLTVPPLSLPDRDRTPPPDELCRYEAITLLTQRARAVHPAFAVTPENAAAVLQLCRRLDGIPLAIELAAVRLRALSVRQVLERLDDRFQMLTGRHQTLCAAIDGSHELCSPRERLLWARASVFAGGFDLRAAEEVCGGAGIEPAEVVDLATGLVDKSILTRCEEQRGQEPRYRMLDVLRRYGLEKLRAAGEDHAMTVRHRDWFLRLAEEAAAGWFGPDERAWMDRLRSEHDNARAALEFCLSDPGSLEAGLRIGGALWCYWVPGGLLVEGQQWLDRLVAAATEPSRALGVVLWVSGWAASHAGDLVAAEARAEQCRQLAAQLGDARLEAYGLQVAGLGALLKGNLEQSHELCARSWERHVALGELTSPALKVLTKLSLVASMTGDVDRAVAYAEECVDLSRRHDARWVCSWGLVLLGLALWRRGDAEQAIGPLRESIRVKLELNDLFGLGMGGEYLAWALTTTGRHREAARLFGVLEQLWPTVGTPLMGLAQLVEFHEQSVATARAALGGTAYAEAAGHTASHPLQALENLLCGDTAPRPSRQDEKSWEPLTRREQEVAALVAKGLSNKEIAARLVISQRTAEGHVERVLVKLGMTSRTRLAAWVHGRR
ncbi:non-specific serine/threonine protein kinase [Lentzea atacamensis]|uniref:Non-specific serine/threonine protein kinase n=1 Tax=Lentzea atacamensis TaxID=531938 RepID=A0ABX9EIY4_9PSEU|nr:LuxR C-terminal-related transcriptional regulator [Lentzea atacamensis]RAS70111.1 non-specific serine/threonine protein kinase [Lentzea atacamensis]